MGWGSNRILCEWDCFERETIAIRPTSYLEDGVNKVPGYLLFQAFCSSSLSRMLYFLRIIRRPECRNHWINSRRSIHSRVSRLPMLV
jgi:hypothetical protein